MSASDGIFIFSFKVEKKDSENIYYRLISELKTSNAIEKTEHEKAPRPDVLLFDFYRKLIVSNKVVFYQGFSIFTLPPANFL